jgi:hypothetical protein
VSIPTVSRAVTALRERGYDIRAQRQGSTWRYVLNRSRFPTAELRKDDPARAAIRDT